MITEERMDGVSYRIPVGVYHAECERQRSIFQVVEKKPHRDSTGQSVGGTPNVWSILSKMQPFFGQILSSKVILFF